MADRLAPLLAAAFLAACGGGGGDDAPPPTVEPNDTPAQATALTVGTAVTGSFPAGSDGTIAHDRDYFVFTVPQGGASVRFQTFDQGGVECDPLNAGVDTFLEVYDSAGTKVGEADDNGAGPFCEDLTVALAAGTNYVMVGGYEPLPFNYTLEVTFP